MVRGEMAHCRGTPSPRLLSKPQPLSLCPSASGRGALVPRSVDMIDQAVVAETPVERVVVTVYKTSRIAKYLKGTAP